MKSGIVRVRPRAGVSEVCSRVEKTRTNHGHGVELLQGRHGLEQKHDKTSSLDRLDGASEQIWCYGFEVLKDTHPIRVSENLFGFFVVPEVPFINE